MAVSPTLRFDGWSLDRASGDLTRDGQTTRLAQQPLRVLLELADNAGLVVTRETLVKALWPKGIVDFDNSLNGIVRRLRIALGDDSETPRYIETLPRIGYRFIAGLEPDSLAPAHGPTRRPARFGIAIGVAAALSACGIGAWWLARPASQVPSAEATLVPRRTTSQRAYEYYLDAIYQRSRRDIDGRPLALAAFENALREDPDYAEAWAGLSGTIVGVAVNHDGPVRPLLERAHAAAERAVVLDAALPDAHAALGHVLTFRRDYAGAERELAKAIALSERSARAWHAISLLRAFQGRADEALAAIRRARELEPTTLHFNILYGSMLYYARRNDDAIAHLTPLLAAHPHLAEARVTLVRARVASGRAADALADAQFIAKSDPGSSVLGLVHAALGRRADAHAEALRITNLDRNGGGIMYGVATIHAALGAVDESCRALGRAVDQEALFLGWVRLDPRLDPLRGTPCFEEILRRIHGGVWRQAVADWDMNSPVTR
jgi:DNA-binding winged helix-turn-helix (wHTH) protein/Flp pilus assembly protein TadD